MTVLLVAFLLAAAPAPAAPSPGPVPPPRAGDPLPRVALRTPLGEIVLEVDVVRAPVSARNFLRYVDARRYDGGAFHRTVTTRPDNQPRNAVKIDVVQAGAAPGEDFPPIPLERTRDTGLAHVDGAISMARDGPDTATSDFFVCVGPQPELDHGGRRNPDGQGFAAFGRVVKGMDVVRKIHAAPAQGQSLRPPVPILEAVRLPP
ncbi:MAG TPA: peptidylprolyl isomerase [Anaeromyxobacteraceae bacterium]|nr:peptidylprolyl isomerase [Anaeromyxobacteraceae bacterium]